MIYIGMIGSSDFYSLDTYCINTDTISFECSVRGYQEENAVVRNKTTFCTNFVQRLSLRIISCSANQIKVIVLIHIALL